MADLIVPNKVINASFSTNTIGWTINDITGAYIDNGSLLLKYSPGLIAGTALQYINIGDSIKPLYFSVWGKSDNATNPCLMSFGGTVRTFGLSWERQSFIVNLRDRDIVGFGIQSNNSSLVANGNIKNVMLIDLVSVFGNAGHSMNVADVELAINPTNIPDFQYFGEPLIVSTTRKPSAPLNVNAGISISNSKVVADITWSIPSDQGSYLITSYSVYRDGVLLASNLPINNLSYTDNNGGLGLSYATTYTYTLTATNQNGEGAVSAGTLAATPLDPNAPIPPPKITLEEQLNEGIISINITWDSVDGATAYYVYRTDTNVFSNTPLTEVLTNSYTDVDVAYRTVYRYGVVVYNSSSNRYSAMSESSITTHFLPSPPRNLNVIGNGLGVVVVSWDPPSWTGVVGNNPAIDLEEYELNYDSGQVFVANTSIEISGLTPGSEYTFSVNAKNALGASGVVSKTYTLGSAPTNPTSFAVELFNGVPVLSWAEPSYNGGIGIISYRIYNSSTSPVGTSTPICIVDAVVREATHILSSGKQYYKMSAVGEGNIEGAFTSEISITPSTDTNELSFTNLITNGSFDNSEDNHLGWDTTLENGVSYITAPTGMYYEHSLVLDDSYLIQKLGLIKGHTYLITCKVKDTADSLKSRIALTNDGFTEIIVSSEVDSTNINRYTILHNLKEADGEDVAMALISNVRVI